MSASKGFLNQLFEFSFSHFIGIRIIGILYGIGIFFAGLFALGIGLAGFRNGVGSGAVTLILSPFFFLLYVILLRITLEGFVAALRTAQNTTFLVENAKRNP